MMLNNIITTFYIVIENTLRLSINMSNIHNPCIQDTALTVYD